MLQVCMACPRQQRILQGENTVVYAGVGQQGIKKREEMKGNAFGFRVAIRPGKRRALLDTPEWRLDDLSEIAKVYIRAKGEHPFRVIFVQPAGDRSGSLAFRRSV